MDEKSRRERRKESRLAKNKKKFDSSVQHQQSSKSKRPTQMVETSKTKVRDSINNVASNEDYSKHSHTLTNSERKKDWKREKGLNRTPKSNSFNYLEKEMNGIGMSAEEDLRFERKLAKKLKVKNGRLSAANDDIDSLLDGIPSLLDKLGDIEKGETGDLPRKPKKSNPMNEDLDDEISFDEGDEESDSLVSSEENEELDDEVSSGEGDEEFDSLVNSDENDEVISPEDSNKGKRRKTKFEEYIEDDVQGGKSFAQADLALERKLAKKLKVKTGKVEGDEDDVNMLLEGIPVVPEYPRKSLNKPKSCKLAEQEQTSASEVALPGKYLAPHLRSRGGNE